MRTLNNSEVSHVNGAWIITVAKAVGKALNAARKRPVSTGAGVAAGAASTQIGKEGSGSNSSD